MQPNAADASSPFVGGASDPAPVFSVLSPATVNTGQGFPSFVSKELRFSMPANEEVITRLGESLRLSQVTILTISHMQARPRHCPSALFEYIRHQQRFTGLPIFASPHRDDHCLGSQFKWNLGS